MALDFVKINQGLDLLARSRGVRDKLIEAVNLPTDTPPGLGLLRFDGNPDLDVSGAAIKNAVVALWQAKRDQLATDGKTLIQQGVT